MISPGFGGYANSPLFEGCFASPVLGQNLQTLAPYASAVAGPSAWRAAPGGLLQGRFGFGNAATGLVWNAQQTPTDVFGVVIPLASVNGANGGVVGGPPSLGGPQAALSWQVYDPRYRAMRLRAGLIATLMSAGNFYLRFAGGANYGDTVYASITDGSAISGAASGAVASAFKVVQPGPPGCLACVSSTAKFF